MNLTGALDNTGTTLAFTAATGSWNLLGGSITGGTVTEAGGAELTFTNSGGTLAGVTFDNDLDLASLYGANATVTGGLTLADATVVPGQRGRLDLRSALLQRHPDARRHRHGALRQERLQRGVR